MAALNIDERAVRLVRIDESIAPGRSAEPLNAGSYTSLNAAGEYESGGANGGVCISTVLTAHAPVSVVRKGILAVGNALDALDFDAPVFGADDGTLDDTDGAGANHRIGSVIAGLGAESGTPAKLLRVDA